MYYKSQIHVDAINKPFKEYFSDTDKIKYFKRNSNDLFTDPGASLFATFKPTTRPINFPILKPHFYFAQLKCHNIFNSPCIK